MIVSLEKREGISRLPVFISSQSCYQCVWMDVCVHGCVCDSTHNSLSLSLSLAWLSLSTQFYRFFSFFMQQLSPCFPSFPFPFLPPLFLVSSFHLIPSSSFLLLGFSVFEVCALFPAKKKKRKTLFLRNLNVQVMPARQLRWESNRMEWKDGERKERERERKERRV